MRVFVTGAAGFIGSHLTRLLLQSDYEVLALAIPGESMQRLTDIQGQFRVIEGELADTDSLRAALAAYRPDVCFHLAWYTEPGLYHDSGENVHLLQQSLGLFQIFIEAGVSQVVGMGTCLEYDVRVGFLNEQSPLDPQTLYDAAKLSLYLVGRHMLNAADITFTWARLFFTYGPGEHEDRLLPSLSTALRQGQRFPTTAGEQVRDFLYVKDVASALWFLAQHKLGGAYNLCSGIPITIRHFIETAQNVLDKEGLVDFGTLPYREWEPMFICGSNLKLRDAGWKPTTTLSDGIAQTVDSKPILG